jgi:phenylalanyl-tRNA synthetase alpha subunit
MNTNDMISKIKEVLNLSEEIKLEQLKLENGTVLEADEFKSGKEIFILTEDEKVALPIGEYQLEDGRILSITEEGVISELKEEKEEEAPAEEEKEEMGYATKEELAEVKKMVEEIKAMLEPKEEKEEMSAEDLGNLLTEELAKHEKVELSEVPEEVQEELNQPAAEPIQANPEAKQTLSKFNISSNRRTSTLDRIMNKLSN